MVKPADIAVGSAAFKIDPFPVYARLRADNPVVRAPIRMPMLKEAVLLSRYNDVSALLKDRRFSKDRANAGNSSASALMSFAGKAFSPLMNSMLDKDDPDHARLRRLVQTVFTTRRVEEMTANIRTIAQELLDDLEGRSEIDLIRDYAMPLPVTVISDMLGVPIADRKRFVRWSNILIENTQSPVGMVLSVPSILAFIRYIRAMIAMRRAEPQDDLITALVQAPESTETFSDDELLSMIVLLLTAGHETTTNLIGHVGTVAVFRATTAIACGTRADRGCR